MASYHDVLYRNIHLNEQSEELSNEIQLLLLDVCNKSRADLYNDYYDEMSEELISEFEGKVRRLLNNEPLQYITGYQPFYGYNIKVNEAVLIPRNETEELVANILIEYDTYFEGQKLTIADVGTGSGAIAIALGREEANFTKIYATDISEEALALARENALANGCDITFMQGDMLQPLIDNDIKLDILVSNPPYIPVDQEIQKSVEEYEPHVALFGGNDGLFFYRKIFENAHRVIKDRSMLAFEIGYDEKDAIIAEVKKYFPYDPYTVFRDINGKDRMLFIYHNIKGAGQ